VSGAAAAPGTPPPGSARPTVGELRTRLGAAFPEAAIEVADDSHLHAGHAGAAGGGGHYTVRIVSGAFAGRTSVARHRLVYDAVADWIPHRVHALAIIAKTPSEVAPPPEDPLK
jgi:BolA family transcriptional regulator, general stress-responsive regulator